MYESVLTVLTVTQTKDFVKFLGLVAILYLGTCQSRRGGMKARF